MFAILAELPAHLVSSPGPLAIGSNLLLVNISVATVILIAGLAAALSLRKQ